MRTTRTETPAGDVFEIKQAHILLVDDEPTLWDLLKSYLNDAGFVNVHTAADGVECLEIIERLQGKIQVVTLGQNMPRMKGTEVMQALAQNHRGPVGIIMITGQAGDRNLALEFLRLGSENVIPIDFFPKPFTIEKLHSKIEDAIRIVQARRHRPVAR